MERKAIIIFISVLFASFLASAQKGTAVFGFQIEPIIPTELFRVRKEKIDFEKVSFTTTPKPGYMIGGHIGLNFGNRITLETGINMIKRNFQIQANETEQAENPYLNFVVQNYEIPVAVTYYVRLGERLYMANTTGVSHQILPSNLRSFNKGKYPDGRFYELEQRSARLNWLMPTFKGGVGWEYRTEKDGYIYAGFVYHLFTALYDTNIIYKSGDIRENFNQRYIGDFFGLVLRYNFMPSPLHKRKK